MKAQDVKLLDFIGGRNRTFIIPPYQRNYQWNERNCKELFDDIINIVKTGKDHYLGNIVYYISKDSSPSLSQFVLIDGQQRLTTVLLLLCAIRDLAKTDKKYNFPEDDINAIDDDFLKNRTKDRNNSFRIRLKQTLHDYSSFEKIVNNGSSSGNTIIDQNYEFFKKLLKEHISVDRFESDSKCVTLVDFYSALVFLQIVDVNLQVDDDLSAVQLIFEKINSTGKPLSFSDLARNFLLLANNPEHQDYLYNTYWTKIEDTVTLENLENFITCFLKYSALEEIKASEQYTKFKHFFYDKEKEEILSELNILAPYFTMIKNARSGNNDLDDLLNMLSLLKSSDFEPLLLFLFKELYKLNVRELIKIVKLVTDYTLRFRIVAPSRGGGAIRTFIFSILSKLKNSEIKCSYDAILFELSNSPSPSSRFPQNDEFQKCLCDQSIDTNYARVCLMRIENEKTKNILVSIKEVTVEHLMPQKLTKQWETYLGGKDKSVEIFSQYLNRIGNLTPISQAYNSVNSNKEWNIKLGFLRDVQFTLTNQITSKYKTWFEKDIENRGVEIAKMACETITAPLQRSRNFSNGLSHSIVTEGYYTFGSCDDFKNTKVDILNFKDKLSIVKNWKELFIALVTELYTQFPSNILEIANDNAIHKRTAKFSESKDPIIARNPELLNKAHNIGNSDLYLEVNLSAERIIYYSNKFIHKCGLSEDDVSFHIKSNELD